MDLSRGSVMQRAAAGHDGGNAVEERMWARASAVAQASRRRGAHGDRMRTAPCVREFERGRAARESRNERRNRPCARWRHTQRAQGVRGPPPRTAHGQRSAPRGPAPETVRSRHTSLVWAVCADSRLGQTERGARGAGPPAR
eukprot:1393551-Prymnesium_polylepis.1